MKQPPSDKSTTDDDSTQSSDEHDNPDDPDNKDDDSEATLSESEMVGEKRKRRSGSGSRSGSGRIVEEGIIYNHDIRFISFSFNPSIELVGAATKLGLTVTSDLTSSDLIIYESCQVELTQLSHPDNSVCQHWITDSAAANTTLPICLYNLNTSYDPNAFEDPALDIQPDSTSKYACWRTHPLVSPNEELVDALRVLKQDRIARDEKWNALAYTRALSMVKSFPHRIRSKDDILLSVPASDDEEDAASAASTYKHPRTPTKPVKNIGDKKIKAKIEEWLNYGRVYEAEKIRGSDMHSIYHSLYSIQGIGPKKAFELSRSGVRSVDELVDNGKITQDDATLAQHLNNSISRDEVERIANYVMGHARSLLAHPSYAICGGFRRAKPMSNDIDIIITQHGASVAQLNHFLVALTDSLQSTGFLTKLMRQVSLCVASNRRKEDHDYQSTMLGVVESSRKFGTSEGEHPQYRRLDVIVAKPASFHLEILSWTGSVMYERDLRSYVRRHKLKLNASSVYNDTTDEELDLSLVRSERHLLRVLRLPWIAPQYRNCD